MDDDNCRQQPRAQSADSIDMKGALGVRKQARDISAGGWRGGGNRLRRDAVLYQQDSQPQHVQGERVTYEQRPGSRGMEMQPSVCFSTHILSLGDDSDDGNCGSSHVHGGSSPQHACARPSSPDASEAVGWAALNGATLPSTPICISKRVPGLPSTAADISFLRRSLVHLDLSGNRHDRMCASAA